MKNDDEEEANSRKTEQEEEKIKMKSDFKKRFWRLKKTETGEATDCGCEELQI